MTDAAVRTSEHDLESDAAWSQTTQPSPSRTGDWYPDRWYRRALRGALAGCAGTALMTPLQFEGASKAGAHAPPYEITRRLHRALSLGRPRAPELQARGFALHVAFGAIAGAVYGIAAPRRAREVTGLGYAAAILGVSYFGFLPMLNLHPPAHRDHWNRQVANAAGHAVYGLTLAVAMRLSDTNANP